VARGRALQPARAHQAGPRDAVGQGRRDPRLQVLRHPPGSLPKLLNIKNGDLITSVNGTDLKSVDGAMSLYTKLRRASNLSITIERKGETINKEITIQ
jgi:type II secretory pathway component PulC